MPQFVRTKVIPLLLACAGIVAGRFQPLSAQDLVVSAPLGDVRYEVAFTRFHGSRRIVSSAMNFTVGGNAPVYLSLPAWTPGAYEISNFARNVTNFTAEEGGSLLPWDKADPDTWRVLPNGVGRITVRFDYLTDSLDNAKTWAKDDFLLFNGTNLFLYPEGRPFDFPASVSIITEGDWKIVTGMAATTATTLHSSMAASSPRTFYSSNYHDLVDMPFFVGAMDVDSTLISGTWVRFATYPARSISGGPRIAVWEALKRIIPAEVRVFGEVPWTTYSIMQIVDPSYGGASGLEHQNSHVDVLGAGMAGSPVMPSLYAHEIFHAWNVKRLRPIELWPYRYDQEQPTTLLWVSEGITDYYADLAEVRGGIVDAKEFYVMTGDKIAQVEELPPTSLEDASLSTWIHPRDGTEYIYYPKGSLAGLLIDIMLRDATDNGSSLDVVMRTLYNTNYKSGRGFTSQDFWSAVSHAANNRSFEDFYTRYVNGREPFPYDRILPLGGMRLARDTIREPRVGLGTVEDSSGVHITEVGQGSPAEAAGAQPGDLLLSVGGINVSDPNWSALFRAKYLRLREGSDMPIRVRRGASEITLNARLRFAERYSSRLIEDPRPSSKARRVREGLLRGTLKQ